MTVQFPATPEFTGSLYLPSRVEADVFDLVVEGTLPPGISGTFFQVAPDPQYPPMLGDDIFFNGDGAVTAFRFINGRVNLQRRYVHTQRLEAQRAAGRSLHGLYRNVHTNDPSVRHLSNSTANTNVIEHAGVLLAMKEDSPPYALDPLTLATKGLWNFGGQMTAATFTAHPKRDPETGHLLCFAYEARGEATPDIAYYEFDAHGQLVQETWIKAPYAAMIHDFAVTQNYVIFPLMPLTADIERIKAGGRHFEWQPGFDQVFGVLPRNGNADDIRWFCAPNGFQGHTLNAYDEAGRIYVDMPVTSGNIFYFFPPEDGLVPPPETLSSRMMRWTFDMNQSGNALSMAPLTEFACEFPRCDDRYVTRKYQHGWMIALDPSLPFDETVGPRPFQFFNQLAHLDVVTGKSETWFGGPSTCFQEPVFVPKHSGAPEGEGYLMALANRMADQTTDLLVLDALRIAEGPIATVKLPFRLRMSLHGNWSPSVG